MVDSGFSFKWENCSAMGSALLLLRYAYVSNMFFFSNHDVFFFSALGKGKRKAKKKEKRSQKWDFCVFLSIHHLSLLFSFFVNRKIIHPCLFFSFLHVLQTETIYALRIIRPDVTTVLSVSINHTRRKLEWRWKQVRARLAILVNLPRLLEYS